MSERPTKEFTTPGGLTVVIKTYLTAREAMPVIDEKTLTDTERSQKLPYLRKPRDGHGSIPPTRGSGWLASQARGRPPGHRARPREDASTRGRIDPARRVSFTGQPLLAENIHFDPRETNG